MSDDMIIRLPCKIGSPMYHLRFYKGGDGFIWTGKLAGIHITEAVTRWRLCDKPAKYVVLRGPDGFSTKVQLKELGKTLFTDYEAAQKALKEAME